MLLSDLEYILLRLIRRFVLKGHVIDSVCRFIPYYQTSVGEKSPVQIVDLYWKYCLYAGINPVGKTILEIGAGRTNGTAYEITARGGYCAAFDPSTPLDRKKDEEIFNHILKRHPHLDKESASRINDLRDLPASSVDLVLSHSVLEHVVDMDDLLKQLNRVIHSKGSMIHVVDYRDHFFKYPFHFLKFSEPVWYRFLDPGDLTRARVGDHIGVFRAHGFKLDILEREMNVPAIMKIKRHIHRDFRDHSLEDLATSSAVLLARKC
jgi:SAM-dependent methyltransferase